MTNDELYKVSGLLLRETQRNRKERGVGRWTEWEGGRREKEEGQQGELSFDFQPGGGHSH